MNNKIKKLFAGIGLGVAGICLLTGCSANIDVSQKDVDNTLSNANAFFTSVDDTNTNLDNIDNAIQDTNESLADINDNLQSINNNLELQTKDSECVRQYLLSLLSNGIYDSISNQEFSMTLTYQQYENDMLETSMSASFSAYWEDNTYKAIMDASEGRGTIWYQEVVRNVDNDTHAVTYTENLYTNDIGDGKKTYTTKENLEYFDYLTTGFASNYYQLYVGMYAETYIDNDSIYSMETIDGGLRFVRNSYNLEDLEFTQTTLEFVNGKLTKEIYIKNGRLGTTVGEDEYHNDCPYYVMTCEFNDTVTPIEFDKTGYTLETTD